MLPRDTEARRKDKETKTRVQTSLEPHMTERETVVKYSDNAFREAAIEWLVETDQVCSEVVLNALYRLLMCCCTAHSSVRAPIL